MREEEEARLDACVIVWRKERVSQKIGWMMRSDSKSSSRIGKAERRNRKEEDILLELSLELSLELWL